MPEITIPPSFRDNPAAAFDAGFRILSYMTHPDDSVKRATFVKASNQQLLIQLRNSVGLSDKRFQNIDRKLFEKLREETIVVDVKPNLMLPEKPEEFLMSINAMDTVNAFISPVIQKNWKTVAAITQTLMRIQKHGGNLRGGMSIKKATYFLERVVKKGHVLSNHIFANDTDMKKAWKKYRSIAHFTLPFYKMYNEPDEKFNLNMFTPVGISNFMILIGNLEEWLLDLSPQHSEKSSIVNADQLWLLPNRFQIQRVPIKVEEFSADEMQILHNYKSA